MAWRIGYAGDPLGFAPLEFCGWNHRFDDLQREYRTLYCAEQRLTCFRETLAGFRPSTRAVQEYRELFGEEPSAVRSISREWLEKQALARGRIELQDGEFVDIDELAVRRDFERLHTELLADHGMDHLDITEVRGRNRVVTQALSRWLFDQGAAGILYRSNLDDLPCVALFEGRAAVARDGEPEPLSAIPSELREVCTELGLTLSRT